MKNVITLEIVFTGDPEKRIELIQTINSVVGSTHSFISDYNISKVGERISLTADLENESDLRKATESLEMQLIYGACRTLGIKFDTFVNGAKVNPVN